MNNVDFDELLKQGVLCGKKMVPAYCTTDLSIFKENDLNRDIRPAKVTRVGNMGQKIDFNFDFNTWR